MPVRIYIAIALIIGPLAHRGFSLLANSLSPWWSGPLIFALVLLTGELLLVFLRRGQMALYLEEALKDCLGFIGLGILAAVTYQASHLYLAVQPNLGIVATAVFLLFMGVTEKNRRR